MIRKHSYKKRRSYKKGKSTRKISRKKINMKRQFGGGGGDGDKEAKTDYDTLLKSQPKEVEQKTLKTLNTFGNIVELFTTVDQSKIPEQLINKETINRNTFRYDNMLYDRIEITTENITGINNKRPTSFHYKIKNIKTISSKISIDTYGTYFCKLHKYYDSWYETDDNGGQDHDIYIVSDAYDFTLYDIINKKKLDEDVVKAKADLDRANDDKTTAEYAMRNVSIASAKAAAMTVADEKSKAAGQAQSAYNNAIEAAKELNIIDITKIKKKQIYTWFLDIAKGIKCMHDVGYAHLNINLENIVINLLKGELPGSIEQNAKLSNFGYAIESSKKLNASIYNKDDPFMAPELDDILEKFEDYKKCDIYSLGMVFGELLITLYPIELPGDGTITPLTESGLDAMVYGISDRATIENVIEILTKLQLNMI